MHLSIRWKFILSIGITLIVTYLGLLTWDYWWQRSTAAADMQQLAAERAKSHANRLSAEMAAMETQAESIANSIEQNIPTSGEQLQTALARRTTSFNLDFVIAFDPQFTTTTKLESPAYRIPGRGGQRGGRGGRGGGGGPGSRGFEPGPGGDLARGPEGARGLGRGPDGGPGRGPPPDGGPRGDGGGPQAGGPRGNGQPNPVQVNEFREFNRVAEPAYARVAETKRTVWSVVQSPGGGPPRATVAVPILAGERFIGVVIASSTNTGQFWGDNFGARGPRPPGVTGTNTTPQSAAIAAEPTEVLREFSVIGNDGRVVFPTTAPTPGATSQLSVLDWAKSQGLKELAEDLRSSLDGENASVHVHRVHDVPDLIPGSQPGENYWVAFAPIAANDWVVTSAISESQHMTPIVTRLFHRAIFLISGLVVLLAVTTFVSIRVSRPIERMARAVNELASGNMDARVTDVRSHDEIGQLASAFNTMTGQLKQHVAALTEQTAARETVEAELRIARQIQTDLLPKTFPPFPNRPEFALHAVNVPAHRVAGDFYDFFFTPNDILTVVIADVSGKGVPAALLMAVTRTIIRNLAMEGLTPAQIAERANAMLLQDISDSMFVTMFLCQYNTRTGSVVYVNAGHPKPYCFAPDGATEPFGEITGALLGVNPTSADWAYEQCEGTLDPGQTLLLYTDGVTEARAPDGQMLRSSGVERLIHQHQTDSVELICTGLVDDLNDYQAGQPADDITLLALRRTS